MPGVLGTDPHPFPLGRDIPAGLHLKPPSQPLHSHPRSQSQPRVPHFAPKRSPKAQEITQTAAASLGAFLLGTKIHTPAPRRGYLYHNRKKKKVVVVVTCCEIFL